MKKQSSSNDTEKIILWKELLEKFIEEEDPYITMLSWILQRLIDAEAENIVGAPKGKHSKERKTYFSGTRKRKLDTRLGTIELLIPKLRNGGFIPSVLEARKRSEKALIRVVQEAYINGVSTRKIERLAKSLGIEKLSASQVSQITKGLNEQAEKFRNRKLAKEYPFVWVDALYEKIRDNEGQVVSIAVMTAYGVNMSGKREALSIELFYNESHETWKAFFSKLRKRGVEKIALLVSDAHSGIQKAFKEVFIGGSWQRCKVHFMRNILAHIPKKAKKLFAERLKQIWLQPTKEEAIARAKRIIENYEEKYPKAIKILEEGLEDSLQFYHFPNIDKKRTSSTNMVERANKEIRRRTKVIGVFPSEESYIRLVTAYLMEYTEDWIKERSYIHTDKLKEIMDNFNNKLKKPQSLKGSRAFYVSQAYVSIRSELLLRLLLCPSFRC
jgi:putative transposase